jgi:WD40 repeat protein
VRSEDPRRDRADTAGTIASDPRGGQGVDTVAFSPDGRTLATGDGNRSTYLWAIPKGD